MQTQTNLIVRRFNSQKGYKKAKVGSMQESGATLSCSKLGCAGIRKKVKVRRK